MCFETHSYGSDLDPEVHSFAQRMVLFRRMWVKHPQYRTLMHDIYNHYNNIHAHGCFVNQEHLAGLKPAPPPAAKGRKLWSPRTTMYGPIGILLFSAHLVAASVSPDFVLHCHGEADLNLCHIPFQHLRPSVQELAKNARFRAACTERSDLDGIQEIDRPVLAAALKGRSEEETRIIQ